jgi:glycosyltransferase involved in cell wall biosynthesis
LNIGILTGTFHPEPGGPPTYLYHLLPELQARGHQIRVLTYGEAVGHDYGYPVERITRRQSIPRRLWHFTRAALRLCAWSDVLFVSGYTIPLLFLRPFYRRRIVAKVVSDYSWEFARRHNLTDLEVIPFQTAHHPWKVRLLRWFYHRAVRLANDVIVPSQHVQRLLFAWGIPAERVHLIYNGIPDPGLIGTPRADLRRELGLPVDVFLAATVGRLTPVKGVDVALSAVQQITDIHLVIVGDGEQRPALEALASSFPERVHFAGRQDPDQAMRYLRAADLLILSSHTEGLPHVALEAFIVGTPVVATDVGGTGEVVNNGVSGLLVAPNDPDALAGAIQKIRGQPEQKAQYIQHGLKRVADFRWENTVAQTEQLLTGKQHG